MPQAELDAEMYDPWYNLTQWPALFAEYDIQLTSAIALVQLPALEEGALGLIEDVLGHRVLPACLETLKQTPHAVRIWLKSPHPDKCTASALAALQDCRSLQKYQAYWVQYVCFILRSIALDEAEYEDTYMAGILGEEQRSMHWQSRRSSAITTAKGLYLTSEQHIRVQKLKELIAGQETTDYAELTANERDQLSSELLAFCISSIKHALRMHSCYRSPLMYFLAHLGNYPPCV